MKRKEGNLRENGNIIIRGYDSREDGDLWMNIREEMEAKELEFLSPYAACSVNSREETRRRQNVIFGPLIKEIVTGYSTANLSGE